MYGEKIKTVRELRGFSQEYLADKLGIAQNTYSKIETGQTKLSAETLEKIAVVLGISIVDITSTYPAIINFSPVESASVTIQNTYIHQLEFAEKMIASKDSEIQNLKEIIQCLIKEKEMIISLIKRN